LPERSNWKDKKHGEIETRNIRTFLYHRLTAFDKERDSYVWRSPNKNENILRPFSKTINLLLLLITLKTPVTSSNGTIGVRAVSDFGGGDFLARKIYGIPECVIVEIGIQTHSNSFPIYRATGNFS